MVTGAILSIRGQDSPWGFVNKMLVRDDSGFKVWVTCPAQAEGQRGSKVTFTATIEPSRDDPKFGFGKRPAKLTVLSARPEAIEPAPHDESFVPDVASNRDDYYANR